MGGREGVEGGGGGLSVAVGDIEKRWERGGVMGDREKRWIPHAGVVGGRGRRREEREAAGGRERW